MLTTGKGLATLIVVVLVFGSLNHYTTVSSESLRALRLPETNIFEDDALTASWLHTPSGATTPTTVTVTGREGETPEQFRARYDVMLALFPPD